LTDSKQADYQSIMSLLELSCKALIHNFLVQDQSLHLYEIGDLDDFFFSKTRWLALQDQDQQLTFMSLLYSSPDFTVLLAFGNNLEDGRLLMDKIRHILPDVFYSHLTPGLKTSFEPYYDAEPHGLYTKMKVTNKDQTQLIAKNYAIGVERLKEEHLEAILTFYNEAYPGNWFDPHMLATGQTFGIWDEDKRHLIAIAGIHVYSVDYKVAALGNIATHLQHRRKGLARKVTSALILSLYDAGIETIGLNVKADNYNAIQCYESLGFAFVAHYEENLFRRRIVNQEAK
jgi:ribosomal protein S18 acetylase RimI-like enzyme